MQLFWIFTFTLTLLIAITFQIVNGNEYHDGRNQRMKQGEQGPNRYHSGYSHNSNRYGDRSSFYNRRRGGSEDDEFSKNKGRYHNKPRSPRKKYSKKPNRKTPRYD